MPAAVRSGPRLISTAMSTKDVSSPTLVGLLSGPDRPGIVAEISSWIFQNGGNILHADQHHDHLENVFFQRVEWASGANEPRQMLADFAETAGCEWQMQSQVALSTERPRVAVFVSRQDHCFHDLLHRFRAGEYRADLVCTISNHPDLREFAERDGVAYHHVPVTSATKSKAEAEKLGILKEYKPDLIILARYMQVLTGDFLARCGCPVINIHHSSLPAFAGAKPYHQAYQRGVKIIGATAHYVTEDLDAGPIIHQDVARISHRRSVQEMIRNGRDLEKLVLASAVRWHLENRVLVYGNKTIVFD